MLLLLARTRYFAITAILTLAVVAIQLSPSSIQNAVDGFIVRRYWLVFAAGILLYWHVCYATPLERWCCNLALLVILTIAVLDWELMASREWSPRAGLAFTAAFTLVMANSFAWDRQISAARWLAPFAACGAVSYSIYLSHPLIVGCAELAENWLNISPTIKSLVVVPVVVLLSIGFGYAYYWAVERHFAGSPATVRHALHSARPAAAADN